MSGKEELTFEERKAWFEELLRTPCPGTKPKQVNAGVSERLAEAARANPDSVRVVARGKSGETIVERPRSVEQIEVTEVDAQGRPAKARRYDTERGGWGSVEYIGGYGPSYHPKEGVVQHQYNPLDALKGR